MCFRFMASGEVFACKSKTGLDGDRSIARMLGHLRQTEIPTEGREWGGHYGTYQLSGVALQIQLRHLSTDWQRISSTNGKSLYEGSLGIDELTMDLWNKDPPVRDMQFRFRTFTFDE
tara:strand:- start:139 stop:489 length:351 start_codon:yes stop_codon:yes gene_type:complete